MKATDDHSPPAGQLRMLAWFLRFQATVDLLALVAVFAPSSWIDLSHRWCGFGEFPSAPIAGYLARSASAMYVLHAATVLYLATDVVRYWRVIRFLAVCALVHGCILYFVDSIERMPLWWRVGEGPLFAATGALALVLLGRRPPPGV